MSQRVLSLPLERVRAVPFVGIDGRPVCGGGLVKPRGLERLFSVSLRRVKKQDAVGMYREYGDRAADGLPKP